MMNRFKITVAAAALIAGTGFANAQGTGMSREAPSAGSSVQPSAPSSDRGAGSATQMNHDATQPGMTSSQSGEKSPAAGGNQRADETMRGDRSKSMNSENGTTGRNDDRKAEGRQDRNGSMNAESRDENKSQTVGQAGAGAKLSTEQRTRITTVIRNQHVAPADNVNFSVSVGTRVPRDVAFHPLPADVVTVYPEWRGYNFVLVRDEIVVIDPDTFEIVAVLNA